MSNRIQQDPPVRTRVFGGPEFERDGIMLSLSPYQSAFIGLVGTTAKRGITRQRVAWLLWEQDDLPTIRHRIRQLLLAVKRRLGVDPVRREDDLLVFDTEASFLDAIQYREFVNIGRLHHAAIMLREGLLSSLAAFPTEAYADWVSAREIRLRGELRQKASQSWTRARTDNDWIRARDAAEALICIDPDDEHFVRLAIEGRAKTGDVEGAEAAFVAWTEAAVLRNERPQKETVRLVDRVRRLHTAVPQTRRHSVPHDTPPPPFQGQEATLRRFVDLGLQLPPERARIVTVEGEPGIGKTRIVQEALAELHLAGHLCMMSSCSEFESQIPLSPLIDTICADLPRKAMEEMVEPMRSVLLSLLPPHALDGREPVRPPPLQPDTSPRRLLESFVQLFERLAESQEHMVLAVDDLQWIDESSISVLEFLRRRWSRGGLLMVFTYRPEELKRHPLAKTFIEGLADVAEFIEVPKLLDTASRNLVRTVAAEPIPDILIERVAELGNGNPLYLLELATEAAAGRISPSARGVEGRLPPSIRQLVERRLRLLTRDSVELLEHLSVLSEKATLHELSQMLGRSEKELAESLANLLALRLGSFIDHHAGPPHELLRSAVEQRISPPRKALIHRVVARFLASKGAPPADLAIHFAKAGERKEAYRHALRAADQSEEAGAIPETIQFIELASENAPSEVDAALLKMRVGMLRYRVQDFLGAAPILEAISPVLFNLGHWAEGTECQIAWVDAMCRLGEIPREEAEIRLTDFKRQADTRGNEWLVAMVLDVEFHLFDRIGDLSAIHATLEEAKRRMGASDPRARCRTATVLALHAFYGDLNQGLEYAREGARIAREYALSSETYSSLNMLLLVLGSQGRTGSPEGQEVRRMARELTISRGDVTSIFRLRVNEGVWYLDIGEYDRAHAAFESARVIIKDLDAPNELLQLELNLGELHCAIGEFDEGLEHYELASSLMRLDTRTYWATSAMAGIGYASLATGDLARARQLYEALPADPREWYFDPTAIVRFRIGIMERKGLGVSALDYLLGTLPTFRHRFLPTWTKLKVDELRLRRRLGVLSPEDAHEVLEVSKSLNLSARIDEIYRAFPDYLLPN